MGEGCLPVVGGGGQQLTIKRHTFHTVLAQICHGFLTTQIYLILITGHGMFTMHTFLPYIKHWNKNVFELYFDFPGFTHFFFGWYAVLVTDIFYNLHVNLCLTYLELSFAVLGNDIVRTQQLYIQHYCLLFYHNTLTVEAVRYQFKTTKTY
jgi:hypothetical protein